MGMFAILKDKKVIPEDDPIKWANWLKTSENRHVDLFEKDDLRISTVFLSTDHGFFGRSLWFETMIFGGPHDGYQERYTTWDEAMAGHKAALKLAGVESEATV